MVQWDGTYSEDQGVVCGRDPWLQWNGTDSEDQGVVCGTIWNVPLRPMVAVEWDRR